MKRPLIAIGVVLIASGLGSRGEAGPPHSKGQGSGARPRSAQQNPLSTHPQHKIPQLTHPRHQSYKHAPKHANKHSHGHRSYPYYSRAYRQPYWYGYGYAPYRLYSYPYRYQYPYAYPPPIPSYPYYPPPLYIPAETVYGPEAVKRFMGVGRINVPAPDPGLVIPRAERAWGIDGNRDAGADGNRKIKRRASNPEALALAWKFIGFGDAHFANQKYTDAFQRYKKAAQAAPGLAQAYFRQGYALAVQERYELAARALQRGLALDPGWARSKFRADELYGPNQLAKTAHMDALAKAVKDKPHDVDAVFLLAIFYYFDDQRDRAAPLLHQAAQMLGPQADCLDGFIAEEQ